MKFKLILFLLLIFPIFMYSQYFNGGLLAGLATSQVDGDTYSGYNKMGIMFGAFVGIPFKKDFEVQLEFKYIEKGSRNVPKKGIGDFYKLRLKYVEMPVLLAYQVNNGIGIDGGFAFGYLFGSEEQFGYDGIPAIDSDSFDKMDLSMTAGLYYELKNNLRFNLRLEYSILPVRKIVDRPYLRKGQHNSLICFGFYYKFKSSERTTGLKME